MKLSPLERFKNKLEKVGSCIVWKGSQSGKGYGQMSINGKNWYTHRYSMFITKGSLSDKLVIDHICRNRLCANPKHLREVTRRQNALENSDSLGAKNKAKKICIRGHKLSGRNLVIRKNGTRRCRACHNESNRNSHRKSQPHNTPTYKLT